MILNFCTFFSLWNLAPASSGSPMLACLRFPLVKRRAFIHTPRTPGCSVWVDNVGYFLHIVFIFHPLLFFFWLKYSWCNMLLSGIQYSDIFIPYEMITMISLVTICTHTKLLKYYWPYSLRYILHPCGLKRCEIYIYIHTHNEILLNHKKTRNLAICNNVDESRGYYVKWNKSDRERQIPYDFTYMWNLKNKTNKTES